jgi:DNA-binding transcriptional LysR family regulator
MDRETLLHLPVVIAVARRRSFAGAAAELRLSPSAVSHSVRMVETHLGTPLFRRTTRSVSLTEIGERFLARADAAVAELADAIETTQALRGRVTGVLRINSPRIAQRMVVGELLAELARRHPQLTVEVTSDEALVDIVAAGYDAGVRLGEMIGQEMVAVRLTPPFQAIMVASPAYLARAGAPARISELQRHNTIGYRLASHGGVYAWELSDRGEDVSVVVTGTARVTDALFALDLALAGVGIAYLFEPLARTHLESGELRQVLPEAAIEEPGLFLYFPRHLSETPKLRAFIEVARERLARLAQDERPFG